MIKHLSGDFETVEYDTKKYAMLYDNVENEPYPVHWHNAVEFIMPLKNEYTVTVNGTDYSVPENDVLIVPPGELHSMPAIPGRRIIFQCDNSILGEISALEPVMRSLNAPVLINADMDKELHVLAKKTMLDILSLYTSKSELADVKIYVKVIELFMALREYQLEQQKIVMDCDDEKIDEYSEKFGTVLKYIDNNYMYDITLEQLADVAGYSKYHFSRIFKQYNSMSYLQYINARRTKAAELLLLDPGIPITEVAMRSGFKSLTTFNRIFKEIKHCTPTDFKKLYALR
ncbi:AraC family transcriptional regulator [Ruminococcus flavefaciens]|uniref:AraC family transcriptional regulator n=1 Tax=Ruminococcus flavefaciens TaxID=1265 RepID=UPI0026ED4B4F|nr:AraC family transcriptional regulator [Ruminococcus flavefaciens]MDD7516594.1 AraC family transcriptional regulator [Ruminococcus flavefaciens]MDY5690384.1 AraC family transcriptional regulator [Ruminococcus flavefaciens]